MPIPLVKAIKYKIMQLNILTSTNTKMFQDYSKSMAKFNRYIEANSPYL